MRIARYARLGIREAACNGRARLGNAAAGPAQESATCGLRRVLCNPPMWWRVAGLPLGLRVCPRFPPAGPQSAGARHRPWGLLESLRIPLAKILIAQRIG